MDPIRIVYDERAREERSGVKHSVFYNTKAFMKGLRYMFGTSDNEVIGAIEITDRGIDATLLRKV